jgi:hypothetical protein
VYYLRAAGRMGEEKPGHSCGQVQRRGGGEHAAETSAHCRSTHNNRGAFVNVYDDSHCFCLGKGFFWAQDNHSLDGHNWIFLFMWDS